MTTMRFSTLNEIFNNAIENISEWLEIAKLSKRNESLRDNLAFCIKDFKTIYFFTSYTDINIVCKCILNDALRYEYEVIFMDDEDWYNFLKTVNCNG